MNKKRPVVLVIAGLDPSGGAGIQADIQTLSSLQCHCTPVISVLTTQDSMRLYRSDAVDPDIVRTQLEALANEFTFSAIKLGALGTHEVAIVVGQFIQELRIKQPNLPIILDPVIKASGGGELSNEKLLKTLLNKVIPYCTLITPNDLEINILTGISNTKSAAMHLTKLGVSVLVTGGHNRNSETGVLNNHLFFHSLTGSEEHQWSINTIEGEFRGTGCMFSSSIAGFMANNFSLIQSIEKSQVFVSNSLKQAYTLDSGQKIPQRTITL
jgi:hydroxymethylpyrimidine/phosphomethylpyrimidine kinase